MAAYGLDIGQITAWTYPQLRLLDRQRRLRERQERRWQLMLAAGTLPPESFDSLWEGLGGAPLKRTAAASAPAEPQARAEFGKQSHAVDADGNVVAPPGTPLLSDIALGKARPPTLIPIKVVGEEDRKAGTTENNG